MYTFTDKMIYEQIQFLKLVHPFLIDEEFSEVNIEIRPLERLEDKSIGLHSLNLWHIDYNGLEHYKRFLSKLNNRNVCMYYSGFTQIEKGKINNDKACYTQILPMDFDHTTYEDLKRQLQLFDNLDIEYNIVFTGHGYQVIILLDKPYYDKGIYREFTHLVSALGLNIDTELVDAARILRLPGTYNSKDIHNKIATKLISATNKRYKYEDIIKPLQQILPTKVNKKTNDNQYMLLEDRYNQYLKFDELPGAVKKMLKETDIGLRDPVIMFLVPFLRNVVGISKDKAMEVFRILDSVCSKSDIYCYEKAKRIWDYNYRGFGAYNKMLSDRFGFIKFDEYKCTDQIKIPNILFHNYSIIHETIVRMILLMFAYERRFEIGTWTKKDICKYTGISERTFDRYISKAVETRMIYFTNKHKNKSQYRYALNHTYYSYGFTLIDPGRIIDLYFDRFYPLKNTEAKLYVFFYQMIKNNQNSTCYASQETIGNIIGITQQRVSELTDILYQKKRILKDCYKYNYSEHCIYELV